MDNTGERDFVFKGWEWGYCHYEMEEEKTRESLCVCVFGVFNVEDQSASFEKLVRCPESFFLFLTLITVE